MSFNGNSTTELPEITTEKPYVNDDSKFLIVPLVVIIAVMILSILVYLMARRRRNNILKYNLLSLYDMESNGEDEWENMNSIEHPNYCSTDYTTTVF